MSLPRVVTIDGPAGAGKTSVAFAVASALGYLFVDTGAFYRAVTLAILRAGALHADIDSQIRIARQVHINITSDRATDDRQYTVYLDGDDVTRTIRSREVEAWVSQVSAIAGIRDVLNAKYRELVARCGPVIMVGRDIGSVVLPDADVKIYLDASLPERAARRHQQLADAGRTLDLDTIRAGLAARDQIDSERAVAPLAPAPDALIINTDNLDLTAVIERVKTTLRQWSG